MRVEFTADIATGARAVRAAIRRQTATGRVRVVRRRSEASRW
jgi:hypothetical protein